MTYLKLNDVYQLYDFKEKYGDKKPSFTELLKEFDSQLLACVNKLHEVDNQKNPEAIAAYQEQAINLRRFIKESKNEQVLARAIQSFDDLLVGKIDDENNYQLLLLARRFEELAHTEGVSANIFAFGAAVEAFLGVGCLVVALVLAIPTGGISLLFLIDTVVAGCAAGILLEERNEILENKEKATSRKEKITSFAETSQGLFSSDSDHQEDTNNKDLEQQQRHEK
ncbi:MAG: phage holin family protein [Gammaproteobacteria bacterium]|nr:phage holin family protein [Gammaproteobacteria bacterium]